MMLLIGIFLIKSSLRKDEKLFSWKQQYKSVDRTVIHTFRMIKNKEDVN